MARPSNLGSATYSTGGAPSASSSSLRMRASKASAPVASLSVSVRMLSMGTAWRTGIRPSSTRSEEHTSELQSPCNLVCRLLLEKNNEQTEPDLASELANALALALHIGATITDGKAILHEDVPLENWLIEAAESVAPGASTQRRD